METPYGVKFFQTFHSQNISPIILNIWVKKKFKNAHITEIANVEGIFAKNGMLETYLLKIERSLEEDEIDYIEKNLMERMIDQYNHPSLSQLNSGSKLKTLSRLKTIPGRESYLKEVEISKQVFFGRIVELENVL